MTYTISLIVGIVLLVVSLRLFKSTIDFIKKGEKATATVVKLNTFESDDGTSYTPIFSFTTASKQEFLFTHPFSSDPPSYVVGDTATIVYDPAKPENAKILTYPSAFMWTIVIMIIALALIVFGVGYHYTQSMLR